MTKNKIVCPRCFGNGYIRIPNEAVGINKQVIAQCTMCDSQGEILLGSIGGTVVSQTPVVKTYNGVDTLTIIKTKKGIKQHAYDKLKEVNDNK